MSHVLAMAMQKGGVGKTTSTLNIGVNLARRGARVLLIDIDPQANLTQGLGIDPNTVDTTVYEVLINPEAGTELETVTTTAGVDLIPSTLDLAGAELELAGKIGRELLLQEALTQTRSAYDFIMIDTPPSLGLFTLNALAAADAVIVPLQVHAYAFKAMPQFEATLGLVRKLNPALRLGGILCTMTDRRTNLSQAIEQQIRERYGELVFNTVIPQTVKLAETPVAGEPISAYAPGSAGDVAYRAMSEEVEARFAR